jgi:LacI family transcriptional regulator
VERLAISCLKVLRELNLRIPEDVALAGFSDNPVSPYLAPALTSIRQPTFEIGQISAELLIEQIENPSATVEHKTIQLGTTLDIRASSLKV